MTSYFDLAVGFYEKNPHLLIGVGNLSADELHYILAKDLSLVCTADTKLANKFGKKTRRGVHEDLDDDLADAITDRLLTAAFRLGTTTERLNELRNKIEELLGGFSDLQSLIPEGVQRAHLEAAAKKLRASKHEKAAATFMGNALPSKVSEYLALIIGEAARAASNQEWGNRGLQGIPVNFDSLAEAAALQDEKAIAQAHAGLHEALLFGAGGTDFEAKLKDTDTPAKVNLLHWQEASSLARHYPQADDETVADVDERVALVAKRINYPFGLMTDELRKAMISAIFLTHCTSSDSTVHDLAALARNYTKADDEWFDHRAMAESVNRAVIGRYNKGQNTEPDSIDDSPQGFDFLRVAAAAISPNLEYEKRDASGWPSHFVQKLMNGSGTPEAATLVQESIPLTEANATQGLPSWVGTSWETFGEFVLRKLRSEESSLVGGTPPAASTDDDGQEESDGAGNFNHQMLQSQNERLKNEAPLKCLREFRNVLVNTETKKSLSGFTVKSLIETNAFLKKRINEQLGADLAAQRDLRNEVIRELRNEGINRFSGAGVTQRIDNSSKELDAEVITNLHEDNMKLSRGVGGAAVGGGFVNGVPIRSGSAQNAGTAPSLEQEKRIAWNRKLAGDEAPELMPPDEKITWLTVLKAETVTRNLAEYSTASDGERFTPGSEAAKKHDTTELAGLRLREAAMTLQAFTMYFSKRKCSKTDFVDQLGGYLESTGADKRHRDRLLDDAVTLGVCLIMDAYTPSEEPPIEQRETV